MDVTQGQPGVFSSLWYDETGTMLSDLAAIAFGLVDSGGHIVLAPTATGVGHPGTGVYTYTWQVPSDQSPGDYAAIWTGTDTDGSPAFSDEDFQVLAANPNVSPFGSWATLEDVATYTGVSVTTSQLAQAQAIVDMFAGRTYVAQPRIGTRDQYWLKLTVCYQAAWMTAQPDLFQRIDLAAITMGSRAVALKDDSLRIAPLAAKALSKVSWMRGRSLHVQSPFTDSFGGLLSPNADSAANDLAFPWFPAGTYGG